MLDEVELAEGDEDEEEEFFGEVSSERISGLLFVPIVVND